MLYAAFTFLRFRRCLTDPDMTERILIRRSQTALFVLLFSFDDGDAEHAGAAVDAEHGTEAADVDRRAGARSRARRGECRGVVGRRRVQHDDVRRRRLCFVKSANSSSIAFARERARVTGNASPSFTVRIGFRRSSPPRNASRGRCGRRAAGTPASRTRRRCAAAARPPPPPRRTRRASAPACRGARGGDRAQPEPHRGGAGVDDRDLVRRDLVARPARRLDGAAELVRKVHRDDFALRDRCSYACWKSAGGGCDVVGSAFSCCEARVEVVGGQVDAVAERLRRRRRSSAARR